MKPTLVLMCFLAAVPTVAHAPQIAEFEVATIKSYVPGSDPPNTPVFSGGSCHGIDKQYSGGPVAPPPLGRCVFNRVLMSYLVSAAYKSQISGGPAWVTSDYFNFEGKAEDPATTTEADLLKMLQSFLTTRVKLQHHIEQRQVQGFVLRSGKNKPNMKPSEGDAAPVVRFGPGAKCTAQHATMGYFANSIRGMARGPVTDETGLTGSYDFSFEWTPNDPGSFISEMQAQLGLRVEPVKVPAEFLVVDHAEKPVQQ
jgi:uncharacterized protein (TIGR03435 family)